ncbi:MAG: hypothetical protein COA67_00455 [Lutibacter sp.]|nr:MAG: hypothetical protein COA67_00455 [Lutibacter sp.]
MKKIISLLLVLLSLSAFSQEIELSNRAEIGIITCGPGTNELFTAFGHSAIRVKDPLQGIDIIYNYGTFDFNQPNFYGNFAKGNTLYFLGTSDTGRFIRAYNYEKRWIKEQVLDLQPEDVQKVFDFLQNNALPKNRDYLYNYFFDNCSTRLYDLVNEILGQKLAPISPFLSDPLSHRELMQLYLSNQPWGDFGIDLGLGSPIDRKATSKEYLFLPENIFIYFDNLKIEENGITRPIVKQTKVILPESKIIPKRPFFTPLLFFSVVGLLIILLTLKNINNRKRSKWLDFTLFFTTGIVGLILLMIWLFTNHISAKNNFNVLWAFAPNLFVSFFLLKTTFPKWIKKYNFLLLILLILVIVLWLLKVQVYSIAVLPILLFLGFRYYYLCFKA